MNDLLLPSGYVKREYATRKEILYLKWDFDCNPVTCSVVQWYDDTRFLIEVIEVANLSVEGICDIIKDHYPMSDYLYIVHGICAGKEQLTEDMLTNYGAIKDNLNLADGQINLCPYFTF